MSKVEKENKIKKAKKSEKELDKEALMEDNISIFVAFLIVIVCCVVGIFLGVCLYKLAISSSAFILNSLFW